jgi:hypothetical protein
MRVGPLTANHSAAIAVLDKRIQQPSRGGLEGDTKDRVPNLRRFDFRVEVVRFIEKINARPILRSRRE